MDKMLNLAELKTLEQLKNRLPKKQSFSEEVIKRIRKAIDMNLDPNITEAEKYLIRRV